MAKTYFPFGYWPLRYLPGFYWPSISHGHRVYRGTGGLGNVDWTTPVGFAQADAESIALSGLGHDASARYTYAVRPVAGNGWLEAPDVSNTCEFETDASADWLGNRPTPVEWLDAIVEAGGKIDLSWSWRTPYGGAAPEEFALYCSTSPYITPGAPEATESFVSDGGYSHTFCLTDGQSYWFAVTTRKAGVESHLSAVIGPYVADAAAPGAPTVSVSATF